MPACPIVIYPPQPHQPQPNYQKHVIESRHWRRQKTWVVFTVRAYSTADRIKTSEYSSRRLITLTDVPVRVTQVVDKVDLNTAIATTQTWINSHRRRRQQQIGNPQTCQISIFNQKRIFSTWISIPFTRILLIVPNYHGVHRLVLRHLIPVAYRVCMTRSMSSCPK